VAARNPARDTDREIGITTELDGFESAIVAINFYFIMIFFQNFTVFFTKNVCSVVA
jgi:hypothetical protein